MGVRHPGDPARPGLGPARAAGREARAAAQPRRATTPSDSACSRSSRATATARSTARGAASSSTRRARRSAPSPATTTCRAAGGRARSCASAAATCPRRSARRGFARPGASPSRRACRRTASFRIRARGLARLRPVPRLLQDRLQPASDAERPVRPRHRELRRRRRPGQPAALPLRASSRRATTTRRRRAPATSSRGGARTPTRGGSRPLASTGIARPFVLGRQRDPQRPQPVPREPRGFRALFDVERVASFMYPGGLVAVHAAGRDRESIWRGAGAARGLRHQRPAHPALVRSAQRSGRPRPDGQSRWRWPRRRASRCAPWARSRRSRAVPRRAGEALSAQRLETLCRGECYHPGDARQPIRAIEVVRIRPQREPGEPARRADRRPVAALRVRAGSGRLRASSFEDPEYPASGRDAVYYVRALQAATPAINAAGLRVEYDAQGRAVRQHALLRELPHARKTTTAWRPPRSAPGPPRSSSTGRNPRARRKHGATRLCWSKGNGGAMTS